MAHIIDFHTHAFPERTAERASRGIADFYSIAVHHNGTHADLEYQCSRAGVEKAVLLTTALAPTVVENVNNYMSGLASELFVPFGTMHPDYPDPGREIDRFHTLGLKGLKLHPDMQETNANDPRLIRIYKELERAHLPVLIHAGDDRRDFSRPDRIAAIKDACPSLTIIAAHLGGYRQLELADRYILGKDFYIDTSSSLWYLDPSTARDIIRRHGTDKVLFGTDYPVACAQYELERVNLLGLNKEESECILYRNGYRLLFGTEPKLLEETK